MRQVAPPRSRVQVPESAQVPVGAPAAWGHPMTRLDTIALRQRRSIVRDGLFAALVALASVISLSSIGTAVSAANPMHLAQR